MGARRPANQPRVPYIFDEQGNLQPYVQSGYTHSLGQLWGIDTTPPNGISTVEEGWIEAPGQYPDIHTHLVHIEIRQRLRSLRRRRRSVGAIQHHCLSKHDHHARRPRPQLRGLPLRRQLVVLLRRAMGRLHPRHVMALPTGDQPRRVRRRGRHERIRHLYRQGQRPVRHASQLRDRHASRLPSTQGSVSDAKLASFASDPARTTSANGRTATRTSTTAAPAGARRTRRTPGALHRARAAASKRPCGTLLSPLSTRCFLLHWRSCRRPSRSELPRRSSCAAPNATRILACGVESSA
jgi:hypothetical protein